MSLFETGFKGLDTSQPVASTSASSITNNAGRNSKNRKRRRESNGGEADDGSKDASIGQDVNNSKTNGGPSIPAAANVAERKEVQTAQAEVNLEKLMKKLHDMEAADAGKNKGKASINKKTSQAAAFMKDKKREAVAAATAARQPSAKKQKPAESAPSSNLNGGNASESMEQPSAKKVKKWKKDKKDKDGKADATEKPEFVYDEAALAKKEERKRKKAARSSTTTEINMENPEKMAVDLLEAVSDIQEPEAIQEEDDKLPPQQQQSELTDLQKRMQQKLGGARFRWINEQLYTTSGDNALELMKTDPAMFEEYHSGFRSQATHWPAQPVNLFIEYFQKTYSGKGKACNKSAQTTSKPLIVDVGCGDADIAKQLIPAGFSVLSFDLVEKLPLINQAQCTQRLPLPGMVDRTGTKSEGAIADYVVCCLSLMGSDWLGTIKEAKRILKAGGTLKVAEVSSRFAPIEEFVEVVKAVGFKLAKQDKSNTHFVLFDFVAVSRKEAQSTFANLSEQELVSKSQQVLKPCIYKRR